jgi:hypothetical protein
MGKIHAQITPELQRWITAQHLFFVATAPLSVTGRVNCSPKGGDCFRVLGPREVAYLDFTGSGIETIAHLQENGRITIMFAAFDGPPKILRLQGRGEVILPAAPPYATLAAAFPPNPGARAIIRIDVERIADSCGFAVPCYTHEGDRSILDDWANEKGPTGVKTYQATRNAVSIDGLLGL